MKPVIGKQWLAWCEKFWKAFGIEDGDRAFEHQSTNRESESASRLVANGSLLMPLPIPAIMWGTMNAEEMVESVIEAALEKVRQTSFIPFWTGSYEVTPDEQLRKLFSKARANDRRVRQMLEKAAEKASRDSFDMQFRPESRNRFGHNVSDTLWIVLKDGYEWDDVIKDAWAGFESENPWFLTDNALKVLKWIESPKNTGDFVPENRIGSQAYLLGTGSYSRIGSYVKEICLKTPQRIKIEKSGGWHGSYKLTLLDEEEEEKKVLRSRRNELRDQIKKRIVEDPASAAQIIKKWLYE